LERAEISDFSPPADMTMPLIYPAHFPDDVNFAFKGG